MGKKSHKKSQAVAALESTTAPLLELKYDAPLFALAAHPTKPIIASGLANGYVFLTEYDPAKLSIYQYDTKSKIESLSKEERKKLDKKNQKFWKVYMISKNTEDDENSGIKQLWKTKRHKGSVRSICFNAEGDEIYTVGSDNVIKRADSLTGKVIKKCEIDSKVAITKILKSQTHPIIITGDEVGNVRVFNLDLKQTNIIQNVHEDAINDIVQLVHKSAYQFLSVGSTTLAVWDVRKEKANLTSENQEDEMLSCGFVDPTKGDTLICGMGEGIVTIWKHEKNHFSDQLSRVKVAKDESIDSVISTLQNDDCIWCGSSDGVVSKVNAKRGQVLETRVHSSIDEVSFLEIDCEYRLISAGMDKLKLWNNDEEDDEEDEEEDFSDSSDDGDDDSDEGDDDEFNGFSDKEEKNEEHEDSDAWEDLGPASESEEKEQEEEELPKPKQSKKHKEKKEEDDEDEAPVSKKNKKQKLSTKQLRNLQKHEHGIRRFDDL